MNPTAMGTITRKKTRTPMRNRMARNSSRINFRYCSSGLSFLVAQALPVLPSCPLVMGELHPLIGADVRWSRHFPPPRRVEIRAEAISE
jgi:hypothetical protein